MDSTTLERYFEEAMIFFSRTDVVISVFTTLIVSFLTLRYLSSKEGIEIQELEYKIRVRKDGETEENEDKDQENKEKEEGLGGNDDDIEEIKRNSDCEEDKEEEDVEELKRRVKLLDSDDVEMIKKGAHLDTKDPAAVKHYVQEMRSMSYKGKQLDDTEKEREEEVRQRQLAQIFSLMNQQKEKFGETSIDDLKQQMNMYQ
ncbi:matrix-remodeling-associated protein 7-like [Clytia hemisphaerica]